MMTSEPFFRQPQDLSATLGKNQSVVAILRFLETMGDHTIDGGRTIMKPYGKGSISIIAKTGLNFPAQSFEMKLTPDGEVTIKGWAWNIVVWLDIWTKTFNMLATIAGKPHMGEFVGEALEALSITKKEWAREMRVQTKFQAKKRQAA
jgi:hypothetical protein